MLTVISLLLIWKVPEKGSPATKMKPFEKNWTVFQMCGICPILSNASGSFKILARFFTVFNITAELLSVSSSLVFGIRNLGVDLEGSVHALCHQAAAAVTVLYMILMAYLKRDKIVRLFVRTQQLCEENETTTNLPIFDDAKRKNEGITTFLVKHVIVVYFIFSTVLGISNGIYCYIADGRQIMTEHLLIPYKFSWVFWTFSLRIFVCHFYWTRRFCIFLFIRSLPWSQTDTIYGWMAAIMFCMMAAGMYFFHNAIFLSMFISIAIYQLAFCEYLREKVEAFNAKVSGHGNVRVNRLKIQLKDWIRFHIASKEYVLVPTNFVVFFSFF